MRETWSTTVWASDWPRLRGRLGLGGIDATVGKYLNVLLDSSDFR
jgi:hypothetical protein